MRFESRQKVREKSVVHVILRQSGDKNISMFFCGGHRDLQAPVIARRLVRRSVGQTYLIKKTNFSVFPPAFVRGVVYAK